MEIKTFEELKPFIAYIFHTENPNAYDYSSPRKSWDNSWIKRCASEYVKLVADTMGVDYDTLLKDLETNESELYYNSRGHMSAKKCFMHHFNKDPKPAYAVRVNVDTYHGQVMFTGVTKGYFRSTFEELWDYNWQHRFSEPFSQRIIDCYDDDNHVGSGPATLIDTIRFCQDLDTTNFLVVESNALQSQYKGKKYVGCNVGYTYNDENLNDGADSYATRHILKFFTTEDEAKAYVAEWKNRKLSKSKACIEEENRIDSIYGEILSRARKLTKDQVVKLKGLIEDIYNKKVADAKLNPLQLCYEYMGSATEIEPYIISDCALRDWFDENYDATRYELVEYSHIFESIMESYDEDVKWKNIKKKDKELIKELAEHFQNGIKGFKVDW